MDAEGKAVIDYLKQEGIYDRFEDILLYEGDDNLNSSCNDEYVLDVNDCIITNGIQNTIMQRINSGNEIQYSTAVRGASFVIIVTFLDNGKYKMDLRIDKSRYITAIQEIKRSLERITREDGFENMNYYLKEWRFNNDLLHNNELI